MMIKQIILEYTKEAVRNTCLGLYLTEEEVERRFYKNIECVNIENVLNYESPKIIDGILIVDSKILNKNTEYEKSILTSFGIYSILGCCKKHDVMNEILATYFASLSVRKGEYRQVKTMFGTNYSFLNHNRIFSKYISIFHELIGEEAIAWLTSKIDDKHSFYDNLYELINYMSIKGSFSKRSLKSLKRALKNMYQERDYIFHSDELCRAIEDVYNNQFSELIKRFSSKYDFQHFIKFCDDLRLSKYNFKSIGERYDLDLSGITLSCKEQKTMNNIFDIFDNFDSFPLSYEDIDSKCREYLLIQSSSIYYKQSLIKNENKFINKMIISKFIIPAINKYGISDEEEAALEMLNVPYTYFLKKDRRNKRSKV